MGKKMFVTLMVTVVAMFSCYNIFQAQNAITLTELALANVEALASYESPDVEIACGKSQGRCWFTDKKLVGPLLPWYVTYCNPFSGRQSDYCTPGLPG